ncbi:hypothetical protein [Actinokineospora fastidiosa]|uniref:VWFA domain-containing protein n=1 Tax=Actinokineospora fastidiosa TaxID=1816 RepID=A0A918GR56_9PSEU|nr:hypothetical protein [Actinokineospora fastidiosa]GGS54803.1 hypothetical protein GCM10010171_57440 [Actinokineospora fastidiosa]
MTSAPVLCPVCRSGGPDAATCARCGWRLSDGPWVGELTDAHRAAFADRLAAARRAHDLAAAARAAGFPDHGDDAVLARLAEIVRDGPPSAAELAAARRAAVAGPGIEPLTGALERALARLVAADHAVLTLVDVASDGIGVAHLGVNHLGVPLPLEPVRRFPWDEVLPWLPADPDERLLVLAGGVGRGGTDPPTADRVVAAPRHLPVETAGRQNEVLVLHRLGGWPVPDQLLRYHPSVRQIGVDEPRLDDRAIRELPAIAPLRHGYSLVAAVVDQRGVPRPVLCPLFPAGARAIERPRATVTVTAPDQPDESLTIAVVAGPARAYAGQCAPVAVLRCDLARGAEHTLQFQLHGAGQVRLISPPGVDDESARASWPEPIDELPPHYQPYSAAVDLVFAIEIGGTEREVGRRRDLAVGIVDALRARHPAPDTVRVGVIGYRDHLGHKPHSVVDAADFASIDTARSTLVELRERPKVEPYAAPVEDALHAAALLRWRALSRRLVVIGDRPPHPSEDGGVARCPNHRQWSAEVTRLTGRDVHRIVVWDRHPIRARQNQHSKHAESTWNAIARPRRPRQLSEVDADSIVDEARLLGRPPAPPLRFPLIAGGKPLEELS